MNSMWWWRWWCEASEINENKIAVEGEFECEIIKEERIVREGVKKACMKEKSQKFFIVHHQL